MGPTIGISNNDRHSSAALGATSGAPITIPLTTTSPSTTNTQSAYDNCLACTRNSRVYINSGGGSCLEENSADYCHGIRNAVSNWRICEQTSPVCFYASGMCRSRLAPTNQFIDNLRTPEQICASLSTTMPPTTTAALASTSAAPTVRIISE
jgi:hypothetical protein